VLGGDERLVVAAQVLFEFWSVATRPVVANGLGWSAARARSEVDAIRSRFRVLEEPPAVVDLWLDIVVAHDLKGKRIHDAHLLATMKANGVTRLLTCNSAISRPKRESPSCPPATDSRPHKTGWRSRSGYQPPGPSCVFGPGFRGRPGPGIESAGTTKAVVTIVRPVVVAVGSPGSTTVPRGLVRRADEGGGPVCGLTYRRLDVARVAMTYPQSAMSWAVTGMAYLFPWSDGSCPYTDEYLAALNAGTPLTLAWAMDQFTLQSCRCLCRQPSERHRAIKTAQLALTQKSKPY